jgi:predicted nucleic acid-binding protein
MMLRMPAVSDTSPILGLAVIGYLNLLQDQFGEVFIPQTVLDELKIGSNFKGASEVSQALSEGWLKAKEIQNKPLAQSLLLDLHQGEAEAITLAIDLGIRLLVMDEKIGRERAKDLGLKTVGVLGVLLNAKKHGRIKSLKDAMTALRDEIGFFISDDLYRQILEQAGE